MQHGKEGDLRLYDRRTASGDHLILRVEPIQTATGEWGYLASFPELRDVSATAPKVLDAILEAEAELSHYFDKDSQ